MSKALPERPDLSWLRKRAKEALAALRKQKPDAKLADAQLHVAREHGFASWRALKQHVDDARTKKTARDPWPEQVVATFLERVGNGDTDAVKAMLLAAPDLVNAVGPHPFWGGRPQALHVAIDTNRDDMVDLLLKAGADVNGSNAEYSHWSPLLLAMQKKRMKAKRKLLQRGAKIGLVEALYMGDDATVLRMLKRGRAALPEHTPGDGSLLMWATTPAAIDRLLALGVSTEAKDRWGATPMEAFSRSGKKGAPLVRHLASRGVPVAPEAYARIADRRALAKLVAADPRVAKNPLVIKAAVDFGHRSLVAWLVDKGADPNARSNAESKDTCLHSAAWNGDLAMVELLLALGADPTLVDAQYEGRPSGWAEVSVRVSNNPKCEAVAHRLLRAEAEHAARQRG
ncbi:MAG TPA: ankyrin repeat domain-containing protein [Nannocystaceae bacterium]|nr:ankyrin repeat domain-containing protein [Nannocystaceae bacterium]